MSNNDRGRNGMGRRLKDMFLESYLAGLNISTKTYGNPESFDIRGLTEIWIEEKEWEKLKEKSNKFK